MPVSLELFKNITENQYYDPKFQRMNQPLTRIATVKRGVYGDTVVFGNLGTVAVTEKNRVTLEGSCDGKTPTCFDSNSYNMVLDKVIDELFTLPQCNVKRFEKASKLATDTILKEAWMTVMQSIADTKFKNTLALAAATATTYVPVPVTANIVEVINGMIYTMEDKNDLPTSHLMSTNLTMVISPKAEMLLKNYKYSFCTFDADMDTKIMNDFNLYDGFIVPKSLMPAGVDILIYPIKWLLYAESCKRAEVFVATESSRRGDMMMDYFELFGRKAITPADRPDVVGQFGTKYAIA